MRWIFDDGGRRAAGYKGETGDCVVRAICIATGLPYLQVYKDLGRAVGGYRTKSGKPQPATPRNGVPGFIYEPYLRKLGWRWTPTVRIGQVGRTRLRAESLPDGVVICALSNHLVTVIDGDLRDTHESSRDETRIVYGYFVPGDDAAREQAARAVKRARRALAETAYPGSLRARTN